MTRGAEHHASGAQHYATKVPEVTLGFWVIKILATTLGETGGDTVTMTWLKADLMVNKGYLIGSAIFLLALIVLVIAQIVARKFHPFLYWATIVASTTFGTTMADFATRSLGIGYTGGSMLLFTCLMVVLGALVLVGRHNLGEHGEHATGRSLLLGGHHLFPDIGHRSWRLDRRHRGPWLRRWSAGVRRRPGGHGGALLLDGCVSRGAVLGRLHFNAAARGNLG